MFFDGWLTASCGSFNCKDCVIPEIWQTQQQAWYLLSHAFLKTSTQLSLHFSMRWHFHQMWQDFAGLFYFSMLSLCPRKKSEIKTLPVVISCWMPLTEILAFLIGLPNLSDTIPFIPRWTWKWKAKRDRSHWSTRIWTTSEHSTHVGSKLLRGLIHYRGPWVLISLLITSMLISQKQQYLLGESWWKGRIEQVLSQVRHTIMRCNEGTSTVQMSGISWYNHSI